MKLRTLSVAAALTVVTAGGLAVGTAQAAPAPTLDVVACVQAAVRVQSLAQAANAAADALAQVQSTNAALQAKVDAALAAVTTATNALKANPTSATALTALATAQGQLTAAIGGLANQASDSTQKSALLDAQAKLAAALNAAKLACTEPTSTTSATPTPTATPTATATPTSSATPTTTTPAPMFADCAAVEAAHKAPLFRGQPGYRPELDSDGDGIACEPAPTFTPATQLPRGGVETGWGA